MTDYYGAPSYSADYPPPPAYPPVQPPPPAGRVNPRRARWVVGIVAALVVGAGAGFLVGQHVDLGQSASAASSPKLDVVSGTFTLTDVEGFTNAFHRGDPCMGISGYDDIAPGTDVTIATDTGRTLALTGLGVGIVTDDGCRFSFRARVKSGLGFYSVTVSHRGTVKERESDLANIQLTLG